MHFGGIRGGFMRRLSVLFIFSTLCAPPLVAGDDPFASPEGDDLQQTRTRFHGATEVVASRLADRAESAGRREVVLTREEINELPVQTTQDLLATLPGLGLTRRGARGIQGDLNLRGGTFEQALILVNGLRVNNAQTGHHNLDLFIPLAAIERIEVLYGPGSSVYGPDAFGGAINIVTGTLDVSAFLRFGENSLAGGGVAGELGAGFWGAFEREEHSGFRDNTEAEVNQLAAGWSFDADGFEIDVSLAGGYRHFGAYAFYSSRFPDERERTEGRTLIVKASIPLGERLQLDTGLRFGRHEDDFILDRNRPDWYRNIHQTDGFLLNAVLVGSIGSFDWAAGLETARDDIESSNLGIHYRQRKAVFGEIGKFGGKTTYALQVRADEREPWDRVSTLALGGFHELKPQVSLRWSYGESFRAPSFTELFYVSPSRFGNPDLEPERGRTSEVGLDFGLFTTTVFERRTRELIDYVLDDEGVWQATNLGRTTTRGAEVSVMAPAIGKLRWQRFGLAYLDSEIDVDPERSAYALNHPELEAVWTGSVELGQAWTGSWSGRFRNPQDDESWAVLDLSLERRILDGVELSIEASNVLDRQITELHGVPLPGRWVTMTLHYRGGKKP
jgi:iron complex outermembrane receptor protein